MKSGYGDDFLIKGVSILGFRQEATAGKAGLEKGDIIVEYDGVTDLTTEKLATLTAAMPPNVFEVLLVFSREGQENSIMVPSGSLGISAMDTAIRRSVSANESTREITLNSTNPWNAMDALFVMGLFVLLQRVTALSLSMSFVPGILTILMAMGWKRTHWNAVGFRKFDIGAIKLACKLVLVGYVISGLYNALSKYVGIPTYVKEISGILNASQSFWLMSPNIIILGPLNEEIIFRGLVFAGFRQRYGWKAAAIISAALFALAHLHFSAFIPAFVFGYIFAYTV